MTTDGERAQPDLQARARERLLTQRLDRVERRIARLSAALDGASVTLVPTAERFRPPVGPDPGRHLQRLAGAPGRGASHDDR